MRIVKNRIDFYNLTFRQYDLHNLTKDLDHQVNGIDTETLNGYCKLICDNGRNSKFTNNINDILKFLTSHRFRNNHNFFFNMNYDINAVIKYLPLENLIELREKLKTNYGSYKLFYIPHKIFRINHSNHSYVFYDVQQFFKTSLEKASQKYLNKDKFIENIDRKTLGSSADYWKKHEPEIVKYCINDAKLTQELGYLLHTTLYKAINLHPQKYISKASITKEFVRKIVTLPNIKKVDFKALLYAFNSYSGGRFEIIKKGNIKYCTLIDINSAYPFHISNLIDVTKGKWRKVDSLHESAHYGFYLVKVLTHYNNILPLPYKLRNNVICFPIIEMGCYLTKEELLAYENYIDYEIISGYEFYPDKIDYSFRNYIKILYDLKKDTPKTSYAYDIYKILMNSLYGCFYEKYKQNDKYYVGKLFNPVYATLITAQTRIDLFKEAMKRPSKIIGFATDSILIDGNINIKKSKELGNWSIHAKGESTILRGGVYKIKSKIKNRGIKSVSRLNTPHGKYKNIFEYIKKQPHLQSYPIITNRPLTFKEVLQHHKLFNLEDINVFTDMSYSVDINKDFKRNWNDQFNNGGEIFEKMIDSRPMIIENT